MLTLLGKKAKMSIGLDLSQNMLNIARANVQKAGLDKVELRHGDIFATRLPAGLDYTTVRGLSKEVQLRLNQHKPETIGQASRIQGITPAAISLLLVWLKRSELARGREPKSA